MSHVCPECGIDFITKRKLSLHLHEIHGLIDDRKPQVTCDMCGRQYLSKSSLINHFRRGCDQDPNVSSIKYD